MQLARMVRPRQRDLAGGLGEMAGKLGEMADALRIEARLSKPGILELYLNALPFGRNARGVGAAAWTYFGRDLASLSEPELLVLAVIPRNPSAYDPFHHPEALAAAARRAAIRLARAGDGLEVDMPSIQSAIAGARTARPRGNAPHFSRYALAHVPLAGAAVRTGLDAGLTRWIEARIGYHLDTVRASRITNAAAIVLDNATGEVRGWVGSRDFDDAAASGQIDGVLIRRQSASTLKPFLYALALERGWTPATLLPDTGIGFGSDEVYRPVNFDRRSRGAVRLRAALAGSLNVPAVFTLSRLGTAEFAERLRDAGFAFPADREREAGLGAAVGNVEVSLLELARAFSTFPRGGTLPPVAILKGSGEPAPGARVFSAETAWTICSILSDPSARATGFGTRTYFRTSFPAMFKSGTSSEFTNLWCVGATPRHTVAVWAGNFDGRAVINKTGSVVPARIVVDILERITRAASDFAMPDSMREQRICSLSGGSATPRCPATRGEFFASRASLPGPCAYHRRARAHFPDGAGSREDLLMESFLEPGEAVRILFPVDGQVLYLDPTAPADAQQVPILAAARAGAAVEVIVDGSILAPQPGGELPRMPARRGAHQVIARTAQGTDRIAFRVE